MAYQSLMQMKVSNVTATVASLVPGTFRPDPDREPTQVDLTYPSGKVPAELVVGVTVVLHVSRA